MSLNTAHALSVVECEFERSAADLKQVEATLAKEFDDLYPKTSINPHKLLQRIENLRAELPQLEREADRLVSEKQAAVATVGALKGTHATLSDTAARADLRDDDELAGGARSVHSLEAAAAQSRQQQAAAAVAQVAVDAEQLIQGGAEIDIRLALAGGGGAGALSSPASGSAAARGGGGAGAGAPGGSGAIADAEWSQVPTIIANATSRADAAELDARLRSLAHERRDAHLSMSQLVALGLASGSEDARLHALGAIRRIELRANEIVVAGV